MSGAGPAGGLPLERFVELFNQGQHWESHEVLEEPWKEHRSEFFQGLILYASAFVHVNRGNRHGILAQLSKAEDKLRAYRAHYMGIDVDGVLVEVGRVREIVLEHPAARPEDWPRLVPYPRLRVEARYVRGDEPELSRSEE